jgi:hypothetical protein
MSAGLLFLAEVLADSVQVEVEPGRVRMTDAADFVNNGIAHCSSPISSSIEQKMGHWNPWRSTICLMASSICAL